jgi:hypothetical protein
VAALGQLRANPNGRADDFPHLHANPFGVASHRQRRVNHEGRRVGGIGLIGSKTVAILRQGGHEVLAASPKNGVNSITGEGLKEAMAGRRW